MDTVELPSVFSISTNENEMADEETESSFKELQDWTRYIAQHQGQRQRLLEFTVKVATLLRDLMGVPEEQKPTSYATAAATSAPGPRVPKKATHATTTKHIQHAITRFERVSKELPGAPRDTLLKVVSQSNLRSAPTPLPEDPKPRKKPACLVKGIRANTVAARLPPGVKVPPSIPAVVTNVNNLLRNGKFDGRVKEIHYGIRRHVTIVFNNAVDEGTSKTALDFVLGTFNTNREAAHLLERSTFSILKFPAVPTVTNDGTPVTSDHARSFIRKHPAWKDVEFVEDPRFVLPKHNPDPLCATLQVKVKDTLKATTARKLLTTSVSFTGITRRCQQWTVTPTSRQCSTCLKWGHSAYVCRSRLPRCDQCAGSHLTALHNQHVKGCKDKNCEHYNRRCANCNEQHEASSIDCPFFKARSSPGQLQKLQEQRVQRLKRNA